jgi:PKD repeat protein
VALTGNTPLVVNFTDTSSPASRVTAWAWDFGDGDTSTDQNPTHIFNAGTFTVTLTATIDGNPYSASDTVTVYNVYGVVTGDSVPVAGGYSIMELPATVLVTGTFGLDGVYAALVPAGHTCWTRAYTNVSGSYYFADSTGYTTALDTSASADANIDVP